MAFRTILITIALVIAAVSPVIFAAPQLVSDVTAGPQWAVASDLRVTKAQCTKWQGVVSTCSINYSDLAPATITPELHYFVYGSWGGERTQLLRSTKNPSIVTTSQAIRDLGARKATLGIWILFCAVALFLMFLTAVRKQVAQPGPVNAGADVPQEAPNQLGPAYRSATSPIVAQPSAGAPARPFGRRTSAPASAKG